MSKLADDPAFLSDMKGLSAFSADQLREVTALAVDFLAAPAETDLLAGVAAFAKAHGKPFAIVPCCVFPALFPDRRVPADEEDAEEDGADSDDSEDASTEEGDDEFDFEEEDEEPTTKKVRETRFKWTLLNEQKAIWTRDPSEVEEEDYNKFYQSIAKDTKDPLTYTHFKAEGEVEFRSILYIPGTAPFDMFDNYYQKSTSIKMYVRRVLITDEFEDLDDVSDGFTTSEDEEMLAMDRSIKLCKPSELTMMTGEDFDRHFFGTQ